MARYWSMIGAAATATLPAMYVRLAGLHLEPGIEALAFGAAILGGACLLAWAAEVAELDISQGLAIAFLALVAVLPEYAVDMYFAWKAAGHPEYTAYATANMTGANRLLIGIAWPVIVGLNWLRRGEGTLHLPPSRAVEWVFLCAATLYSLVLPLKGTISLADTLVFVGLFVAYMWRTAGEEAGEPDIVGPARAVAALSAGWRRTTVGLLFLFSAAVILLSAEPFAEALIRFGVRSGIDEFLLVQWLAPLASEAPEIVVACILTLKGDAQAGMGAMLSSKVNQWTLLVGTLPLVYSLGLGTAGSMHLDQRQTNEILLTSAQSFFAAAVLCDLALSRREAALLFLLFAVQLIFPHHGVRSVFVLLYLGMGTALFVRKREVLASTFRAAFGR